MPGLWQVSVEDLQLDVKEAMKVVEVKDVDDQRQVEKT